MFRLTFSRALGLSSLLLLAGLAALGAGCGPGNGVRAALEEHRDHWASLDIDNYRYELRTVCFCPPEVTRPVLIFVRDGATDSILYIESGQVPEGRYFEKLDTIDELFLVIEDALDREADMIDVTYDENLGIPTRIDIDFLENAIDDEITYDISRFQDLE